MASIFTKIRTKEILEEEVLYEDDKVFILLAHTPHTEAHSLIVPIKEVERFEELDSDIFSHMSLIAQKYAKVLEVIYHPERIGIAIDGFGVDHVHMHIMPIWKKEGGIWFDKEAAITPSDELKAVSARIKDHIRDLF